MKVGFATADWSHSIVEEDNVPAMGGSGWIRIGQYSPHLGMDHVIGVLVYHKKEQIFGVTDPKGKHHLDCDIIYMQRWMLKGIPESVRSAKKSGQIIVNDLDDWYWGMHHRHFAKDYIDPSKNPDENTSIYRNVISASDLVIVSTPFLVDKAKNELGATKVVMLENAIYSVISPEGCASILWRDSSKSLEAAKAMKLTANELLNIGIIDKVIDEAVGGAHRNKEQIIFNIKKELKKSLEEFENYTGEEIFMLREKKFLDIGKEKSFTLISKDYANLITKNNFITFIKKNYLKYKNRNIIFFLLFLAVILYLIK